MPSVADILQAKRRDLDERMQKTPLEAVRALASMQRRPLPLLNTVGAGESLTLIGQICYTPVGDAGNDPVGTAIQYARAGIDAVALFTDADIYRGGLDDLMFVAAAVQRFSIPVISQDYIFDEYQVVEARAAGASGVVLNSELVDGNRLRTLVSSTQRNRMTAIVRIADAGQLDMAIALSPQVVLLAADVPHTPEDLLHLRRLRHRVPAHIRVALDIPAVSSADLVLAAQSGVHALLVPPGLIAAESLPFLRKRLRA